MKRYLFSRWALLISMVLSLTSALVSMNASAQENLPTLAAGHGHTCALSFSGGIRCWGYNASGQLGDGTTTDRYTPVDVSGLTIGVSAIAAGGYHTCALTTGGGVKCWGENADGRLGDGTTTNRTTPVDVQGLTSGVSAIAAGTYHTCALTTGGGVQCWGDNSSGQLGDGTTTERHTPVNVTGLSSGVSAIGAGYFHTYALTTSGGVKCWGRNDHGQLGDGTTIERHTPVDVMGLTSGVAAIAVGGYHTCAMTTGGGVVCWGSNGSGQVGDGTNIDRPWPVYAIGLTSGISAIAADNLHTCALTTNGGAKCWGSNDYGQLGNGTANASNTPVNVLDLTSGVSTIELGHFHTCAQMENRRVRCWGANWYGQLGNGTWDYDPHTKPGDDVGGLPFIVADLGFRPNPDGYSFRNYGGVNNNDYTIEDMRRMFGDEAVCIMNGDVCQVKAAANWWNEQANQAMKYGHCLGMASTSLMFFRTLGADNENEPSDFFRSARTTHDLLLPFIRRYIAYNHVKQMTDPFKTYKDTVLRKKPSEILTDLISAMSDDAPNPTIIGVINWGEGGHAMTPYAIENRGDGTFWVMVYDNNHPDDFNRYVEIDKDEETWSYDLGWKSWSGNQDSHSLGIFPVSLFLEPPVCPFCSETSTSNSTKATSQGQVWLLGDAHVLITDSQGRRLGYENGQFVSEIPNAYASFIDGGLGIKMEPIYTLPLVNTYTLQIDGGLLAQPTTVSVTQFGPGYAVSADGVLMQPNTQDQLLISNDGKQIEYQADQSKQINLYIGLDEVNESYQFQVLGSDVGADQSVTLTANLSTGKLVYTHRNASGGVYDLQIAHITTGGKQNFLHSGVIISATDTHYINFGSWNGYGAIQVEIDHGSNGSIDETVTLNNEVERIYLPLITKKR